MQRTAGIYAGRSQRKLTMAALRDRFLLPMRYADTAAD
jgi:hypothetical protein